MGSVVLTDHPLSDCKENKPSYPLEGQLGACTCSGGPYNNYATLQGIDTIIPVDIYIPGCPPRPEAVLDGLMMLQARIQAERVPSDGRHREIHELPLPMVEKSVP